ncbi:HAD family hydrolase [Hazenella coriacea]|uniref:Putative HAD superfamily Cof-like phosphohydrolase n=1 Tax=Hazenella coriacea TaxID=1179467 RepID=A0A4R3L594_9BACL|nr:HAD family hydrolase [Hazenella coriacea]TCS93960.1 putative HAD superfamily Cof-like phosphohydrolase [Hazenella coriacea]
MDQAWEQVREFHRRFGSPHRATPEKLTSERVEVRTQWLLEEIQEFQEANSMVDQADAMIDLLYFTLGTLVEMGVRPETLFQIVHQANMDKCWEDGQPRFRESDGKVIKPPTWEDPQPKLTEEIERQKRQSVK